MTSQAISDYLTWLNHGPEALIDGEKVAQLEADLETEENPLARLKLRAEIESLQPNPAALEEAFVAALPQWASEHGVTAKAFEAEGVSRALLRHAGLLRDKTKKVKVRAPAQRTTINGTPLPKRVSRDEAKGWARRQKRPFTIADVAKATGASRATARHAVLDLVREGVIQEAGLQKSETAGRPGALYEVS